MAERALWVVTVERQDSSGKGGYQHYAWWHKVRTFSSIRHWIHFPALPLCFRTTFLTVLMCLLHFLVLISYTFYHRSWCFNTSKCQWNHNYSTTTSKRYGADFLREATEKYKEALLAHPLFKDTVIKESYGTNVFTSLAVRISIFRARSVVILTSLGSGCPWSLPYWPSGRCCPCFWVFHAFNAWRGLLFLHLH